MDVEEPGLDLVTNIDFGFQVSRFDHASAHSYVVRISIIGMVCDKI